MRKNDIFNMSPHEMSGVVTHPSLIGVDSRLETLIWSIPRAVHSPDAHPILIIDVSTFTLTPFSTHHRTDVWLVVTGFQTGRPTLCPLLIWTTTDVLSFCQVRSDDEDDEYEER